MTIYNMVDFGGNAHGRNHRPVRSPVRDCRRGPTAAWKFGIPTSESHSAHRRSFRRGASRCTAVLTGINRRQEWVKVIYGLVLSTVLGLRR